MLSLKNNIAVYAVTTAAAYSAIRDAAIVRLSTACGGATVKTAAGAWVDDGSICRDSVDLVTSNFEKKDAMPAIKAAFEIVQDYLKAGEKAVSVEVNSHLFIADQNDSLAAFCSAILADSDI